MESQKQKKAGGTWTSFGKLVIVGTVAAVCGLAAIFSGSQSVSSINLLSLQTGYSPEVEQAYLEYLAKYNKQYGSRSRDDITPPRFEIFAKSYEMVKKHNAKADRLYDMELNQFSDLPSNEVSNIKPELDEFAKSGNMITPFYSVMQVRDSWDWSQTDKLAPVSDQLACKASWAISAIETLEAAIAIRKNISADDTRISAQHLIDCDSTNVGCVGGWPARAWKFFQKSGFVAPESYPNKQYLGVKRQCLAIRDKSTIKRLDADFKGRQYVTLKVEALKQLVQLQPLSVAINAPPCFKFYKSGILSNYDCGCTSTSFEEVTVNEIVTILGFGTTK